MKTFITELVALKNSDWVQHQVLNQSTPNMWSIMEYGRKSYEIRYSKMLRWLLDETANHGLGNLFAREVFAFYKDRQENQELVVDFEPVEGARVPFPLEKSAQTEALSKNIDVFYQNKLASKLLVMVVKQFTDEHASKLGEDEVSQLEKYTRAIYQHETYDFSEYKNKAFLFLTIDGHMPPSFTGDEMSQTWENLWVMMSYAEVINILDRLLLATSQMDVIKIIKDFQRDLQNSIYVLGTAEQAEKNTQFYQTYKKEIDSLVSFFDAGNSSEDKLKKDDSQSIALDILAAIRGKLSDVELKAISETIYQNSRITTQNHTKNEDVQSVIAVLAQELTGQTVPKGKTAILKSEYSQLFAGFNVVRISGRGQGLFLQKSAEDKKNYVYISGDYKGTLGNDGLQLRIGDRKPLRFLAKEFQSFSVKELLTNPEYFNKFLQFYVQSVEEICQMDRVD
ncbi:TPA: PD-(D/E)XK nuclease family protein [Streptococcus suis]|nr:PD-(D/E)XK nuclease family protein [Streptococcus suis]